MVSSVAVHAPSYVTTSDDRAKWNEAPITNGLEIVRQLSPQTYDKVDGDFLDVLAEDTETYKEAGLIAQEAHAVLPDAVTQGDAETPWNVNYNHVLAYALAAIKDLDAVVQAQAARIAALEAKKTRTSKT